MSSKKNERIDKNKKMELEKMLAIIIPSMIGAGGLFTTLAEIFFK